MALIVETGSLVADANGYVTIAEADAYHAGRNNVAWTGSAPEKEAAIIKATQYIDATYATRWKGTRVSFTQALLWPRNYVIQYENEASPDYNLNPPYINSTTIPRELKQAVCEMALKALASELAPDLTRGGYISSVSVGPVSTSYESGAPASTQYVFLEALLATLLFSSNEVARG